MTLLLLLFIDVLSLSLTKVRREVWSPQHRWERRLKVYTGMVANDRNLVALEKDHEYTIPEKII